MNTIQIDARLLKVAQQFQGKNDVRYYLNGICLSKDGRIKATNGYILFVAPHHCELKEDIILNIKGIVPAGADTAIIDIDQRIVFFDDRAETVKRLNVVDGEFPDVDKVTPSGKPKPISEIALGGELLSIAAKAMNILHRKKKGGSIYEFREPSSGIVLRSLSLERPDALAIVMPLNLDSVKFGMGR